MDPHILDIDSRSVTSRVRRWLDRHPQVGAALERAGTRIVVFDAEMIDRSRFQAEVQGQLERAAAAVPEDIRPLFVAIVDGGALIDAFTRLDGRRTPPPMTCPRGAFLGFLGLGEGGAVFVLPDGAHRFSPDPAVVLDHL